MAFSDFRYPDVVPQLGLSEITVPDLFARVPSVPPGEVVRVALPIGAQLGPAAHSEAARMIWMVGPVLSDLWSRYQGQISLNAGAEIVGDVAAGLTGYCDFVVGRGPQRPQPSAPVLVIFEAKRDSIPDGLGQCIAGMVGAQRFNRRNNQPIDPIYGCVTTGSLWRFLRLSETMLTTDLTEYQLQQVDRVLGILMHMIGPIPEPAAA